MTKRYFLSFLAALTAVLALPAHGQTQPRRIVAQTVISEPGQYILPNDLQILPSRGAGIMITASGVDLDLNGATISGPGGIQGTGIHVRNAAGISIRNGKFANLQLAINVENSANVTIRDCMFRGEGLTPTAMPETAVMILQSRGVVVEDNSLYNMGLGLFVRGGNSWGNRLANNSITAGMGFAALGICYNPAPGDARGPRGDVIQGNHITGYPTSIQMNSTSAANLIKGNFLMFGTAGLTTPSGNMAMDNVEVKLP